MTERRFDSIPPPWEEFLQQQLIPIRLACHTGSGWPLVLSLWYLYREGRLYCATQDSSALVGHLREDSRIAFEVAADQPPYRGIRGSADCRLDRSAGSSVLKELLARYQGNLEAPLARKLLAKQDSEVALIIRPRQVFVWDYSKRMKGTN